MKTLKEIMTKECVTCHSGDSIHTAASKMKGHDIGLIPVVDGNKLIGVITDRDLAIRGYAEGKPSSDSINDIISREITTVSPDTSIEEAARMMASHKIRRLPVVDQGELVGIIAIGDLAVREGTEDEAGEALTEISEQTK